MVQRLGERYGVEVHETPVGFKYVGPKMIETGAMMGGEESGGYGFGMHLPERDGIYADLLLLDLFLREKGAATGRSRRPWPSSTSSPAIVLPAHRRPRRSGRLPGVEERLLKAWSPRRRRRWWRAGPSDAGADDEGRLQVLRGGRLVAAHPDIGHGAARARLHGGDVGRHARLAGRCRRRRSRVIRR